MVAPFRTQIFTMICLLGSNAAFAQPPIRLNSDVSSSWSRAGAEVGWVHIHVKPYEIVPGPGSLRIIGDEGRWGMPRLSYRLGFGAGEGAPGDLPAIRYSPSKKYPLSKLAKPTRPFGLMPGRNTTDQDLAGLGEFTFLTVLSLGDTKVTEAGLTQLKGLKNLRALELYKMKLSAAAFKGLSQLPNLEFLNLAGTGITDEELKEIANIKSLKVLILAGANVSNTGLQALASLPELRSLNLTSLKIPSMKGLAGCEKLESLSLRFASVTDEGLRPLSALKNLKHVELLETKLTADALTTFAGMNLDYLELPFNLNNDEVLKHYVAALRSPDRLNLYRWRITDEGLKHLAGLKKLHTLNIGDTKVSDEGLKQLAGRQLLRLTIPSAAQTNVGLKHYLAALSPSDRIDLHGWYINDDGLKELANLKLRHLDLSRTGVTDQGLEFLVPHLSTLEVLDLKETQVSLAGVRGLYQRSPKKFPAFLIHNP